MADWGDQEQLSLAYVMAVAAAAGCVCEQSFRGLDNAGVDLTVFPRTSLGDLPQLHLQVKSKQSMEVGSGDSFAFELPYKQYEKLRLVVGGTPRFLVVVLLPAERSEWVHQSAKELVLRRCGYWLSLRGAPPATGTSRQRVRIPLSQVFEPGALRAMITNSKTVGSSANEGR